MFPNYDSFKPTPLAPVESQITSKTSRITILTDGLIRLESAPDGVFEDRASTFAINRDLPVPKFQVIRKDQGAVEIITSRFHLLWTGKDFAPTSLHVLLRDKGEWAISLIRRLSIESVELPVFEQTDEVGWANKGWTHEYRYGDRHFKMTNLGGTYRTLDRIDGRVELEDGILSEASLLLDRESVC